jgi:hypothetical protein
MDFADDAAACHELTERHSSTLGKAREMQTETTKTIDARSMLESHVKKIDAPSRVSSKEELSQEAEKFLQNSRSLKPQADTVEAELDTQRGHKKLYELLQKIYAIGMELEKSHAKYAVLKKIREELKAKKVKGVDAAPPMTLLVKYVFNDPSKQLVSNYGRALRVAQEENLAPESLASEIERRKGLSAFSQTQEQKTRADEQAAYQKDRLGLFKRFLETLRGTGVSVKWPHTVSDLTKTDPGDLVLFIGLPEGDKGFRLVESVRLDHANETELVATIAKSVNLTNDQLAAAVSDSSARENEDSKLIAAKGKKVDHEVRG